MEKSNIILFGAITFVLLSMAIITAYYAGDTIEVDLNELETYTNHTIEGNTSNINISVNDLIATIIIPVDYEVGDFKITFYGYKNKVVTYDGSDNSGSGGSSNSQSYTWKGASPKKEDVNKTEVITEPKPVDEPEIITEPEVEKKIPFWVWIIVGVLFLIVVIGIIIYFKEDIEESETVVELPNNYNE